MKFIVWFLNIAIIITCITILISCDYPKKPNIPQTEYSSSTDTPSKEEKIDFRDIYPLLEPSNIHVADIPTDIGSLDFLILADEYETEGNRIFTYYDWASFFVDDESRSVMLIFSEGTLSEIKSFPYSSQLASPEEFEQVTVGTTIAEAVEIVGLPFRSTTSGSPSMDFLASDGTIYRFYANEDLVIHGMYCYNERSDYGK